MVAHESYHFTYANLLTPTDRTSWSNILRSTKDKDIQQAMISIADSYVVERYGDTDFAARFASHQQQYPQDSYRAFLESIQPDHFNRLADEYFAYRLDESYTFGISQTVFKVDFAPKPEEVAFFTKLGLIPDD